MPVLMLDEIAINTKNMFYLMRAEYTPDGRYVVVRGRLWRSTNPNLDAVTRQRLVDALMQARRRVRIALHAGDDAALRDARTQVNAAKVGLGERGPVWWTDGAPDYNRYLIKNMPYAQE